MQISTRGRYGLRALVDMALHLDEGPQPLRLIAEHQDISEAYLEHVFNNLRKAGIIKGIRGSQGGYELSRPASEITVGEILRALEGSMAPVHCVGGSPCAREKYCITRDFWEELKTVVDDFVDRTTLQDLVDRALANIPEKPMYYI